MLSPPSQGPGIRKTVAILLPVMVVSYVAFSGLLGDGVSLGSVVFALVMAFGTALVTVVIWRRRAKSNRAEGAVKK
ncbi:MAG: hypothetical protein ACRDZW_08130 [Acidimicrobiales bacterium]